MRPRTGRAGGISFTIDVEDYAPPGEEVRAVAVVDDVLGHLDELGVRGTFFVVGELGVEHPTMVQRIAAADHEIGLHGWQHVPFPHLDPVDLARDLTRGRAMLEDIAGAAVVGIRAPMFSLVPAAHHALDALVEAGFTYSSSVLPARSPLWGDPTAPRHPFRWPNGLVELPCPVTSLGPVVNPYLGGAYLRVLPLPFVSYGIRNAGDDELLWLYCHPYDFDPGEPFRPRAELGRLGSRLMWVGRSRMHRRVRDVLASNAAPPLAERAALVP